MQPTRMHVRMANAFVKTASPSFKLLTDMVARNGGWQRSAPGSATGGGQQRRAGYGGRAQARGLERMAAPETRPHPELVHLL